MGCCHQYFANTPEGDDAFVIDAARMVFGSRLPEGSRRARKAQGMTRGRGVFTDRRVRKLSFFETVTKSLAASGIDFAVYDEVAVETHRRVVQRTAALRHRGQVRRFRLGRRRSVMDTCKAANLCSTWRPIPRLRQRAGRARPSPCPGR
jgi:alcohol dehydrogenase class IV